jgi:hypothetical protein
MTATLTEKDALERVAREYRDRGYVVVVEPQLNEIPEFLRNTRPDLIAFSEVENVLIEVKQTSQLRQSSDLAEFARLVEGQPGWRFELITIANLDSSAPKRWTVSDILARLEEANSAAESGYYQAAFLLAYAASEAAVFAWADSISSNKLVRSPLRTARAIVRQMVIDGAIKQPAFAQFQRMEELRNALAHGVESKEASIADVDALIEFATTALRVSGDVSR